MAAEEANKLITMKVIDQRVGITAEEDRTEMDTLIANEKLMINPKTMSLHLVQIGGCSNVNLKQGENLNSVMMLVNF